MMHFFDYVHITHDRTTSDAIIAVSSMMCKMAYRVHDAAGLEHPVVVTNAIDNMLRASSLISETASIISAEDQVKSIVRLANTILAASLLLTKDSDMRYLQGMSGVVIGTIQARGTIGFNGAELLKTWLCNLLEFRMTFGLLCTSQHQIDGLEDTLHPIRMETAIDYPDAADWMSGILNDPQVNNILIHSRNATRVALGMTV
jgi:hypothetical protein